MESLHIVSAILVFGGTFFMVVGSVGLIRLPDFYARLHAAGKPDTLGEILIVLGLILYEPLSFLSVKLFFLSFFILVANPTATHAVAMAAYKRGLVPWRKKQE